MNSSKSFFSGIQTQFHFPSNSHNHLFTHSPSPHIISFTPHHITNPLESIKTLSSIQPKASFSSVGNTFDTSLTNETLYDLLGISESAPLSEIKQAYKRMALKYHPDVSPPDRVEEYTTMFIRVQEAYETLSDPKTRAMYASSLAFSGSKVKGRSKEMARWKESWQAQVAELKRTRSTDRGERMSWATRIRKQRN
uniref:chaperone protein dnaJ 20, chloroplastic-like n=1 Tax=Erigeron canadensis TaxID=72917 RepID=UPI001CB89172|nr:chaperone protein dnaJ 20, chloroplastic-like [Erigeron canadensis]